MQPPSLFGVGVSIFSYNGGVTVGLRSTRDSFPSRRPSSRPNDTSGTP
jgi:hypothetical protein